MSTEQWATESAVAYVRDSLAAAAADPDRAEHTSTILRSQPWPTRVSL